MNTLLIIVGLIISYFAGILTIALVSINNHGDEHERQLRKEMIDWVDGYARSFEDHHDDKTEREVEREIVNIVKIIIKNTEVQ